MTGAILAFDTSAAHCAAAVVSGGVVLAQRSEEMGKGQAERLMPLVAELLAEAGIGWAGLARIAVGTGPGNFTGVRIAVAAARGLGLALGIPVIGVTSFEALALDQPRPAVALLDARRDQLYAQVFDPEAGEPLLIRPQDRPTLPGGAVFVGDQAQALARQHQGRVAHPLRPLAVAMALIAASRQPGTSPAPLYLRPADAAPPRDPPPVILP